MASRGKQLDEVKAALAALEDEIQEAKVERKVAKNQLEKVILGKKTCGCSSRPENSLGVCVSETPSLVSRES
jgi:uncharacterized Fe-S radical SAM superfamily protein PflX